MGQTAIMKVIGQESPADGRHSRPRHSRLDRESHDLIGDLSPRTAYPMPMFVL